MNTNSCINCIFYRLCDEDIGTCSISDNIVEALQDACVDYIKNSTEEI